MAVSNFKGANLREWWKGLVPGEFVLRVGSVPCACLQELIVKVTSAVSRLGVALETTFCGTSKDLVRTLLKEKGERLA